MQNLEFFFYLASTANVTALLIWHIRQYQQLKHVKTGLICQGSNQCFTLFNLKSKLHCVMKAECKAQKSSEMEDCEARSASFSTKSKAPQ